MKEIGLIKQGSSEWSSPLAHVPKPDLTVCPCIDCQKVNNVTKTDAYPIPAIYRKGKICVCIRDTRVIVSHSGSSIWHENGYFIKKQNHHQKRYSTIEKEALALVLAVKHFEVHVSSAGDDLVVLTDHNPLTFLAKFKTSSQRVLHWSLIL